MCKLRLLIEVMRWLPMTLLPWGCLQKLGRALVRTVDGLRQATQWNDLERQNFRLRIAISCWYSWFNCKKTTQWRTCWTEVKLEIQSLTYCLIMLIVFWYTEKLYWYTNVIYFCSESVVLLKKNRPISWRSYCRVREMNDSDKKREEPFVIFLNPISQIRELS
jgi:hypothetical protein